MGRDDQELLFSSALQAVALMAATLSGDSECKGRRRLARAAPLDS